jgi:hypothetical protein
VTHIHRSSTLDCGAAAAAAWAAVRQGGVQALCLLCCSQLESAALKGEREEMLVHLREVDNALRNKGSECKGCVWCLWSLVGGPMESEYLAKKPLKF